MSLPLWLWAGFWGLLAGSALLLGAAAGYFSHIPQRLTAGVTAFGSSNIPEGLSSSAGMKKAGRSVRYVFGVWTVIAVVSGIAALLGYTVFRNFSPGVIAATTALAAGAILSMLVDTMIPEAFQETHDYAGLITVAGFLIAFALSKVAGG
ncbi:MAG TPA: hypothetical protein VGM86_12040 [Thermoanaerobaculia bacterium]|jgi:ZIP family zinc transporter